MAKKIIKEIDLRIQDGTSRTIVARWVWNEKYTDHFKVHWLYKTLNGGGSVFDGSTVEVRSPIKALTYDPPENAVAVGFNIKPIPQTHKVNNVDTKYWTSDWSGRRWFNFPTATFYIPEKTGAPSISINGYNVTVELDNYDANTTGGYFQLTVDNEGMAGQSGYVYKGYNHVSYIFTVTPGHSYRARFQPYNSNYKVAGEWSEYSDTVYTIPQRISNISGFALTETSVMLEWKEDPIGTTGYTIEYTTNSWLFDTAAAEVSSVSIELTEWMGHSTIITGLTSGSEYFFRMRATNNQGSSMWSEVIAIIVGSTPNPPTTWTSRSTIKSGESVTLYWVHNSADGSKESTAQIYIIFGSAPPQVVEIPNQDSDIGISEYVYTPPASNSDAVVQWKVRTKGILPEYSEWSAQRSFKILVPPMGYVNIYRGLKWWWDPFNFQIGNIYTTKGDYVDSILNDPVVRRYPIFIVGTTEPTSQKPISVNFSISPLMSYQGEDYTGEEVWINAGDVIFEINSNLSTNMQETISGYDIILTLLPEDIILENDVEYKLTFTAALDSGLSVKAEYIFSVLFDIDDYDLDAEIGYNSETASLQIQPYCKDDEQLVSGYSLSVYRRDFDGKFIEVSKGIDSSSGTVITDPHPPLNFARYRIVGISRSNGAIMFNDLPSYPVQEKAIIIQWDDKWRNFIASDDESDILEEPTITGSLLRLPYNISTSEDTNKDVELVEYVGREHPVSYYGTQVGQTASYSVDIVRGDEETLYTLRRLSRYMGNVYVREPNGSGYWASVSVSWNIENKAVIIPVSIKVTRVEGGL